MALNDPGMGVMGRALALLEKVASAGENPSRPLVTVTYAQSVDGSIAGRNREQIRLSGSASMEMTHRLRAAHDAILVGIGTLLADDPRLTVRLGAGENPRPVVLDTRWRTPPGCRLISANPRAPWIVGGTAATADRGAALSDAGARPWRCGTGSDGGIDLRMLVEMLADKGVRSLMVEGGARVITSFLKARLADQVIITIAPRLIGGLSAIDGHEGGKFPPVRFREVVYEPMGADLVIRGTPEWDSGEKAD